MAEASIFMLPGPRLPPSAMKGEKSGIPQCHRKRIAFIELRLVPVRVRRRHGAGRIEHGDLRRRQVPSDGAEILAKLFLIRAPIMTLATVGRCSSQFRATCGTVLLVSLAT